MWILIRFRVLLMQVQGSRSKLPLTRCRQSPKVVAQARIAFGWLANGGFWQCRRLQSFKALTTTTCWSLTRMCPCVLKGGWSGTPCLCLCWNSWWSGPSVRQGWWSKSTSYVGHFLSSTFKIKMIKFWWKIIIKLVALVLWSLVDPAIWWWWLKRRVAGWWKCGI